MKQSFCLLLILFYFNSNGQEKTRFFDKLTFSFEVFNYPDFSNFHLANHIINENLEINRKIFNRHGIGISSYLEVGNSLFGFKYEYYRDATGHTIKDSTGNGFPLNDYIIGHFFSFSHLYSLKSSYNLPLWIGYNIGYYVSRDEGLPIIIFGTPSTGFSFEEFEVPLVQNHFKFNGQLTYRFRLTEIADLGLSVYGGIGRNVSDEGSKWVFQNKVGINVWF